MDAHLLRCAVLVAAVSSLGASYRTNNFIVNAPTAEMAQQIGQAAEKYRRDLAKDWLGPEMPNWAQPCPITAQVADNLGAGGATSFVFEHGQVYGWRMTIQGSLVRILDSVLPHEVTHTVFATHFRQPLPRWADEGACTTVEHSSERAKQQVMLVDFLRTGRGIAFSQMFAMKEYPHDVMPLYSQGYSVARYLISQGGKHKFLEFVADGLRDENWTRATQQHYGIASLGALQNDWLGWVRQGSPILDATKDSPALVAVKTPGPAGGRKRPEANLILRDREVEAVGFNNETVASKDSEKRSIYELASVSKDVLKVGPTAETNWHAPRRSGSNAAAANVADREESRNDADNDSSDSGPPSSAHQVTRPQPAQPARQVILEWSRPHAGSSGSPPVGASAGYPAPSAN